VQTLEDALPIEYPMDMQAPPSPVLIYVHRMCELDEDAEGSE